MKFRCVSPCFAWHLTADNWLTFRCVQLKCAAADRSPRALSRTFWVQLDTVKRSAANHLMKGTERER